MRQSFFILPLFLFSLTPCSLSFLSHGSFRVSFPLLSLFCLSDDVSYDACLGSSSHTQILPTVFSRCHRAGKSLLPFTSSQTQWSREWRRRGRWISATFFICFFLFFHFFFLFFCSSLFTIWFLHSSFNFTTHCCTILFFFFGIIIILLD